MKEPFHIRFVMSEMIFNELQCKLEVRLVFITFYEFSL